MKERKRKRNLGEKKIQEIEQDEETICTINKDSNISSPDLITQKERRKRLLKKRSPDWDIIIKRTRKSALTVQEWENWCDDSVYTDQNTDESSEQSSNSDIDKEGSLV